MSRSVIYLDMDGILTDFTTAVANLFGKPQHGTFGDDPPKGWALEEILADAPPGMSRLDFFWQKVTAAGPDFWENMAPMPWASQLWRVLSQQVLNSRTKVLILTSVGHCAPAASGKLRWLQKYTDNPAFQDFIITSHKEQLAHPNALLIDDSGKNCEMFRKHDGEALLFPAPYNTGDAYLPRGAEISPMSVVFPVLERVGDWIIRREGG
jgi:5'(3')-deoxyribonucleotidase